MLKISVFLTLIVLTAVPAALASGDPNIVIDSGDPLPLLLSTDLNHVQPNGADPLTFDFLNDTGSIVTAFTFKTTVRAGLSATDAASFSPCVTGYFLNCTVTYTKADGTLFYDAFGVLPPDGDESAASDEESAEHEGIPVNGTFHITLNGWTTDATSTGGTLLYSGLPKFDSTFSTAPEPTGVLLLGTGVFLAAVARRFRRPASR